MKWLLALLCASALAQDIRQNVPFPLPRNMGGTGSSNSTTVGALPTCNASMEGAIFNVSDALAPTALVAVAGGGVVHVLVFCNGTTWIVL